MCSAVIDGAEAMMVRTAGASSHTKAVAPCGSVDHCICWYILKSLKEESVFLKNVLNETVKINYISTPSIYLFNILCNKTESVHKALLFHAEVGCVIVQILS